MKIDSTLLAGIFKTRFRCTVADIARQVELVKDLPLEERNVTPDRLEKDLDAINTRLKEIYEPLRDKYAV